MPQLERYRGRWALIAVAVATTVVAAAFPASARASGAEGDLVGCGSEGRATLNPKDVVTSVDLNRHESVGIRYAVTQCNPNDQRIRVRVEGLDKSSAVAGSFEDFGDGIGYLHLEFHRGAIPAGSSDVSVVIAGAPVRTSVLTLTLNKRSSGAITWIIALAAFLGGLLLYGLRSLENTKGWGSVRFWEWHAFQPFPSTLIITSVPAAGAALGILHAGLPSDWTASSGWYPLLLKIGAAVIGAATAAAGGKAALSATVRSAAKTRLSGEATAVGGDQASPPVGEPGS